MHETVIEVDGCTNCTFSDYGGFCSHPNHPDPSDIDEYLIADELFHEYLVGDKLFHPECPLKKGKSVVIRAKAPTHKVEYEITLQDTLTDQRRTILEEYDICGIEGPGEESVLRDWLSGSLSCDCYRYPAFYKRDITNRTLSCDRSSAQRIRLLQISEKETGRVIWTEAGCLLVFYVPGMTN